MAQSLARKDQRPRRSVASNRVTTPPLELVPDPIDLEPADYGILPDLLPDLLPSPFPSPFPSPLPQVFPPPFPDPLPFPTRDPDDQIQPEPVSLATLTPPGAWALYAACRGLGPDRFFPKRGEDQTGTLRICAGCPVRLPCQEYGMGAPTLLQGIWGGVNERQRRKRRSRRGHSTT